MLLRHLFDIRISHIAVSKSKAMNLFKQIIIAFIDSSVSAGCAVPNLKLLIKISSQIKGRMYLLLFRVVMYRAACSLKPVGN